MKFSEIHEMIVDLRGRREWMFDQERDPPLTDEVLDQIEKKESLTFPPSFREFLKHYGAGEFAMGSIYSPDASSGWSLWKEFQYFPDKKRAYLPFSDNGGGDYLAFPIDRELVLDSVVWLDHEQGYTPTESEYCDFCDFIAEACLNLD